MRPIGGLVIGYTGDKHGRKEALTQSLFIMAIPTMCMGFLPTYERAGWWSVTLLIICRLLQGVSVGGQLPASLLYTVEKRDPSQWGYYGSLPMVAANLGTLLGNVFGALLRQVLTEEQLRTFGWRIPFISGILIALVAFYIKRYGVDVHINANVYDHKDSKVTNPIVVAFSKDNRLALFSNALAPMLSSAGFYVTFVWMAIYMQDLLQPPIHGAFWVNACSMLLGKVLMLPLAGHISDRIGHRKTMTFAILVLSVTGPIMVFLIGKGNSILAFFAQLELGICLSFVGAPLCAWMADSFPAEVRLTSASVGYDLAAAIAGGFSPALATALFDKYGGYSPGLIYSVFGVISLLGIYLTSCCGGGSRIESDKDLESLTNPASNLGLPSIS